MDEGAYLAEVRSWSDVSQSRTDSGQNTVTTLAPRVGGEVANYRQNGHQVGSFVTRETSRGAHPSGLL